VRVFLVGDNDIGRERSSASDPAIVRNYSSAVTKPSDAPCSTFQNVRYPKGRAPANHEFAVASQKLSGELDRHFTDISSHRDIVITYKEYPHVDVEDRARELFDLAVAAALGSIRPAMALFDCQMVGFYPTTREPLRSFVDAMKRAEERARILSISFGHGFPCADLPNVGAKMLVVTDGDPELAVDTAREFGLEVYGQRHRIGFESISLPMEEALSRACASKSGPVVVADQSDKRWRWRPWRCYVRAAVVVGQSSPGCGDCDHL